VRRGDRVYRQPPAAALAPTPASFPDQQVGVGPAVDGIWSDDRHPSSTGCQAMVLV
jgi:hypothetical protein